MAALSLITVKCAAAASLSCAEEGEESWLLAVIGSDGVRP